MITFRIPRLDLNRKQILFFLWLFLLVFPKGGFKLGDIPLTWGYLLLGVAFLFASLRKSWSIRMPRLEALFCLLPFQAISALTMLHNGIESIGWTISFITTFFFLPYAFFLLFSRDIETMDLQLFYDLLRKGVVFVSYYGIFLFFYKQIVGKYIEIPFLTVNWGDIGVLDNTNLKCNSRGLVNKLISTYNNGQLFGISMILLLSLYCHIQKNRWQTFVTKLALILTLSRTTWIGLLFHEIFYNLFIAEDRKRAFRSLGLMFTFIAGGLAAIAYRYQFKLSFFWDVKLGGRREQLDVLKEASLFSEKPFLYIQEMTYISMLSSFGLLGLIAYLIAMGGPILFYLSKQMSKARLCILLGLVNYLFISFSDGATLYIPVLAFFWFFTSLFARKEIPEPASFS